jgi:hypothetical protein
MGWSGGTFSRVHDWTDDESAGLNIEASRMDAEDDNFSTGINACLHKGGQNTATANLPMGGFLHTGVGNGSERNHYAALGQVQDLACIYATSAGTNTITLSLTPLISAYSTGQVINFVAGGTNTGAATLNVNSLGAKNIQPFNVAGALTGYEIISGGLYTVVYDGTVFKLINPSSTIGCVAYSSAAQLFNVSTDTAILFPSEDADYTAAPIHSTSSNTNRFNALRTGIYMCSAYAEFGGAASDTRGMWIGVDNATPVYLNTVSGTTYTTTCLAISGLVYAAAGSWISFYVANITANDSIENARGAVHLMSY